jgi:hypothetical protein
MNGIPFHTRRKHLATTPLTRSQALRGLAASAAALAGLPTVRPSLTHAQVDREQELQLALNTLRTDIATYLPPRLQQAFLAQVDAVEPLLLPAVQMAREAARRRACAAQRLLIALRHEAETAASSETFKHDYTFSIVIGDIDAVLRLIAPTDRC